MILKAHAEQVIGLPLMPLGSVPDIRHCGDDAIVTWHFDFERDFMAQSRRMQVIDHVEHFLWPIIDTAQSHERVELQVMIMPQIVTLSMDGWRLNNDTRIDGFGAARHDTLTKMLVQRMVNLLRRREPASFL